MAMGGTAKRVRELGGGRLSCLKMVFFTHIFITKTLNPRPYTLFHIQSDIQTSYRMGQGAHGNSFHPRFGNCTDGF